MSKQPISLHGVTHSSNGSDPIAGVIQFDFDNEGGWLDITTSGSDGNGLGLHYHDTGSTQGIKIESDSRNVEIDAGDNLILNASQAITIENVNALIEFDPLGGGGISFGVSPSTGNLGFTFNDHAGASLFRIRDFVSSSQAVFNTTTLGFFNTSAVAQQSAPSNAQDIANALHAYGLLSGSGTVSPGGAGIITDGTTTVNPATQLDFTSGATVTNAGGGVAQVAITGGSGLSFGTDNTGTWIGIDSSGHGGTLPTLGGPYSILIHTSDAAVGTIWLVSDTGEINLQATSISLSAGTFGGNESTFQLSANLIASECATNGSIGLYDSGANLAIKVQDGGGGPVAIGLYAAPPVVQPAAITAPTGGATVDSQARTAIDAILNAIGAAAGGIGITA